MTNPSIRPRCADEPRGAGVSSRGRRPAGEAHAERAPGRPAATRGGDQPARRARTRAGPASGHHPAGPGPSRARSAQPPASAGEPAPRSERGAAASETRGSIRAKPAATPPAPSLGQIGPGCPGGTGRAAARPAAAAPAREGGGSHRDGRPRRGRAARDSAVSASRGISNTARISALSLVCTRAAASVPSRGTRRARAPRTRAPGRREGARAPAAPPRPRGGRLGSGGAQRHLQPRQTDRPDQTDL